MNKKIIIAIILGAVVLSISTAFSILNKPQNTEALKNVESSVSVENKENNKEATVHTKSVMQLHYQGTSINGAVMQAEDNEYYLRRNEKGEDDIWGCYFMDYESTTNSKNIIIYGHSLDDSASGERFSQLKKLNNAEFAAENNIIVLKTKDEERQYQVVSAGYASALTETVSIMANPSAEEFEQIAELAAKRNILATPTEILPKDNILTLSTCTSNDDMRYVVVAKRIT